MSGGSDTVVLGIAVPSDDPIFLAIVAVHVAIALACVVFGLLAMLREKGSRRHRTFGTTYVWLLGAVFVTAGVLSVMRWADDWPLFVIGLAAFAAATYGR